MDGHQPYSEGFMFTHFSSIPIIKGGGRVVIPYKVLIDPATFFMLSTGLRIILVTPKPCVVQPPFGIQQLGGMMVGWWWESRNVGREIYAPKCKQSKINMELTN